MSCLSSPHLSPFLGSAPGPLLQHVCWCQGHEAGSQKTSAGFKWMCPTWCIPGEPVPRYYIQFLFTEKTGLQCELVPRSRQTPTGDT